MRASNNVILIIPSLKPYYIIASNKMMRLFKMMPLKLVLLPLPREAESSLLKYIAYKITYEKLINAIISLHQSYSVLFKSFINMRPLLEALRRISHKVELRIACYSNLSFAHTELMSLVDLISLIAKTRISGRLRFDELLRTLSNYVDTYRKMVRVFVEKLSKELSVSESPWLMVSDFKGRHLSLELKKYGIRKIKLIYVTPYVFTPLERLVREYLYGLLSKKLAKELIQAHINFLWNYVLVSDDVNEAYLAWLKENFYEKYLELMCKLHMQK